MNVSMNQAVKTEYESRLQRQNRQLESLCHRYGGQYLLLSEERDLQACFLQALPVKGLVGENMFQFLNPLSFLLTLFIAVVVFFYFFRKQYERQTIPSNMLWREVMNEWQASPFLKRMQRNLLFWLQIFALLLLMFALAQPHFYEKRLKGEHIVFIMDTSATMSAEDGDMTRFERAKQEMRELAKELQGQEVTLIKAGQKPEILLNRENNKRMVLKMIDGLQLTYDHENMEKALNLAKSISSQSGTSRGMFFQIIFQRRW